MIDLGVIGKLKPVDALGKKDILEALDSLEDEIIRGAPTYINRMNALFMLGAVRNKVRGHWKEISTTPGMSLIREDMRYISKMMSDPVKSHALSAPGATEEEKRVNAYFKVLEKDLLMPSDEYVSGIAGKVKEFAGGLGSDAAKDAFSHNAKALADKLDARAEMLRQLAQQLRTFKFGRS